MAPPNIVIIMTDQQRADLSAREGFALDTTPFLDDLARQGTWFNRAYTSMPACAPARVSMLTGRYPSATHVRTNHNIEDAFFSKDLFQVARENGYATAKCGKNHSHLKQEDADFWYGAGHIPMLHGDELTEEQVAYNKSVGASRWHVTMSATPGPAEWQNPFRLVELARDWISTIKENPFLLWLSFPEPHNPYQVSEPYYSMFRPEDLPPTLSDESALPTKGFPYQWCRKSFLTAFPEFASQIQRARANYMGMLRLIDDQVKRFVSFLDSEGLRENTILVFLSDHGDFVGEYGLLRKGPELPEALTRIPLQFSGPGIVADAEPHPAHVSIVDLMPTVCEAIGAEMPDGVQGRSLWPLLTGAEYPESEFVSAYSEHGFGGLPYTDNEPLDPADDGLIAGRGYDCLNSWTQSGTMRMVRKGDWKLIADVLGNGQLYNLAEDPVELHDLFGRSEYAAKQHELLADLLTWVLRVHDPLPLPRTRYVMKRDPRNYWTPYRADTESTS